jgi:corrinoid protein of di/trimethylamine methyltransferase
MSDEKNVIIEKLRQAVMNYDGETARSAAKQALTAKVDPVEAMEKGLALGIKEVGERFQSGECFLPHIVMAADAMMEGAKILQEGLAKEDLAKLRKGTIVMATVEGDLHDLGKNIVAMMLIANGFEVYDLGKDVKSDTIIAKAKEVNADIIAISSLMSTTRPYQRELIEELKRLNQRDRFMVLVGGGPVHRQWAEEIGADGYGYNAAEAVQEALKLMSKKKGRA